MINGILNKEELDTFVKDFNLFENYNDDIEIEYLVTKDDISSYVKHSANISFDCLKMFKQSNYEIHLLWRVSDKLQDDFKVVKKYLLNGVFVYLDVQIIKNNLNKWKNTEMKKLRKHVKERYGDDVHTLQVKYTKEDLYPRIKVTFKRYSDVAKWKVVKDIQQYADDVLKFSTKIRFDW
jgi:hypothetical protein